MCLGYRFTNNTFRPGKCFDEYEHSGVCLGSKCRRVGLWVTGRLQKLKQLSGRARFMCCLPHQTIKTRAQKEKSFENAAAWVGHLQRSVIVHLKALSCTARRRRLHQIAQKAADHNVDYAVWPSQTNRPAATLRRINSPLQFPVFSQCIARPRLHTRFNT